MEQRPCICCFCCHISSAESPQRQVALLKLRASGSVSVCACVYISASECGCLHVCVLTVKCVYKHGKDPLGKMHRALSISERVSKMMTGHVAFGKARCAVPSRLRTALCAFPHSQKQTVTHSLPLTSKFPNLNRQKKYTLDKNKFRNVIISSFSFVDTECYTGSPLQSSRL